MHRTRVYLTLLAFTAVVFAQTLSSNLDGLVKDAQGALVPKAEVTVTNTQTTQVFRAETDDKGHWVVASLPTGIVTSTVMTPGECVQEDETLPRTVSTVPLADSRSSTIPGSMRICR